MTAKAIYFDMDGVLAGLFFVKNYSERLENGDSTVYADAKPLYNLQEMKAEIIRLKAIGYKIGVISYWGKKADKKMIAETIKVKREWLTKYFPYADEIHVISPNVPKWTVAEIKPSILVDDSKKNREEWQNGQTIDGYFKRKFINELKKITE